MRRSRLFILATILLIVTGGCAGGHHHVAKPHVAKPPAPPVLTYAVPEYPAWTVECVGDRCKAVNYQSQGMINYQKLANGNISVDEVHGLAITRKQWDQAVQRSQQAFKQVHVLPRSYNEYEPKWIFRQWVDWSCEKKNFQDLGIADYIKAYERIAKFSAQSRQEWLMAYYISRTLRFYRPSVMPTFVGHAATAKESSLIVEAVYMWLMDGSPDLPSFSAIYFKRILNMSPQERALNKSQMQYDISLLADYIRKNPLDYRGLYLMMFDSHGRRRKQPVPLVSDNVPRVVQMYAQYIARNAGNIAYELNLWMSGCVSGKDRHLDRDLLDIQYNGVNNRPRVSLEKMLCQDILSTSHYSEQYRAALTRLVLQYPDTIYLVPGSVVVVPGPVIKSFKAEGYTENSSIHIEGNKATVQYRTSLVVGKITIPAMEITDIWNLSNNMIISHTGKSLTDRANWVLNGTILEQKYIVADNQALQDIRLMATRMGKHRTAAEAKIGMIATIQYSVTSGDPVGISVTSEAK